MTPLGQVVVRNDLEVDPSQLTPEERAAAIRRRIDDPQPPTPFARLAAG